MDLNRTVARFFALEHSKVRIEISPESGAFLHATTTRVDFSRWLACSLGLAEQRGRIPAQMSLELLIGRLRRHKLKYVHSVLVPRLVHDDTTYCTCEVF
jgi:hypothetical protein